jgi:hypothetical protein
MFLSLPAINAPMDVRNRGACGTRDAMERRLLNLKSCRPTASCCHRDSENFGTFPLYRQLSGLNHVFMTLYPV